MSKPILLAAAAMAVLAAQAHAQAPRRPAAPPTPAQTVTGPVTTYWLSAETTSGFGAGMMGGGARPSLGSIMGAMRGAGAANHRLTLQLRSSKTSPAPAADHTPSAGLAVGPKLPLLTPRPAAAAAAPAQPAQPGDIPKEYQRPNGRMLIFWGCGERARPGQPLVLDFAQMSQGKIPAGAMAALKGLNYTPMQPPSVTRNATYGEWPNEQTRQQPSAASSLVGPHAVAGNYTSPINFILTPDKDFLPPLGLRVGKTPAGSALMTWTPAAAARGYVAMAVGGGSQNTVALWISSDAQAAGFGLPDYMTPGDVDRLVAQKALMPGNVASCAIPKEFVDAAPAAFTNLVGYGDEANFSYPPRPADPRTPWNIDWTVKVRYRTAESAILGMDMGAMGAAMGGAAPAAAPPTGARGFPGQPAPSGFPGQAPAPGFPTPGQPAPGSQDASGAIMRGLGSLLGGGGF